MANFYNNNNNCCVLDFSVQLFNRVYWYGIQRPRPSYGPALGVTWVYLCCVVKPTIIKLVILLHSRFLGTIYAGTERSILKNRSLYQPLLYNWVGDRIEHNPWAEK